VRDPPIVERLSTARHQADGTWLWVIGEFSNA
jgi:hypothetical protein